MRDIIFKNTLLKYVKSITFLVSIIILIILMTYLSGPYEIDLSDIEASQGNYPEVLNKKLERINKIYKIRLFAMFIVCTLWGVLWTGFLN